VDCNLICIEHAAPTGPSTELVRSLLLLSSSVQQLGYTHNQVKESSVVWMSFYHFVVALIGDGWMEGNAQALCDLAFLWKLANLHGTKGVELCRLLDARMNEKVFNCCASC
jgi:conserved oligomeric Golgi complex subunit 1